MIKNTKNELISDQDYLLTQRLIWHYVDGLITLPEMLELLPTDMNLAKMVLISRNNVTDKNLDKDFVTMVVNYYYKRLNEYKNCFEQKSFEKLLTVKELFFLTDSIEIEKLLTAKTVDFSDEFRKSISPLKEELKPLFAEKALGNFPNRIVIKLKQYNELFNREKYLKYKPGYVALNGENHYVTQEMIDYAEKILAENNLFPAKNPTEKFIFSLCKKQAEANSEPNT